MFISIKYTLTKGFLIGIFLAKKRRHKAESSQNPTNKTCHRRRYFFFFPVSTSIWMTPKKKSFLVNIHTLKKISQNINRHQKFCLFLLFFRENTTWVKPKKKVTKTPQLDFCFSPRYSLSFTRVVTRNHIYLCVYIYIYIYLHMYTCTYVFIYVYMYDYAYVCIYVYVYICIYIYIYMHVF